MKLWLWHILMCGERLLMRVQGKHQFLECPRCKYRTVGWMWGREKPKESDEQKMRTVSL